MYLPSEKWIGRVKSCSSTTTDRLHKSKLWSYMLVIFQKGKAVHSHRFRNSGNRPESDHLSDLLSRILSLNPRIFQWFNWQSCYLYSYWIRTSSIVDICACCIIYKIGLIQTTNLIFVSSNKRQLWVIRHLVKANIARFLQFISYVHRWYL